MASAARTRGSRAAGSLAILAALLVLSRPAEARQVAAGVSPQGDTSEVSSVELLPGAVSGTFTLRIITTRAGDQAGFWVGKQTYVVDIRNARTPYRGEAVGSLGVPGVQAIRASQFLERELPIARFELDVTGSLSASARWVGNDLEVYFSPGQPGFQGTGRTSPPRPTTPRPRPSSGDMPPAGTPPTASAGADTAAAPAAAQATPAEQYRAGSRVNPFDPVLKPDESDRTNSETRPLPDAETLVLNGIVYLEGNPEQTSALFKDPQGFTYKLSRGDRVQFGFLTQITRNEVVFEIDKYGRKKTVRLEWKP